MNVISGACSIFLALYGYLAEAAWLILFAMVFDIIDGFAARLLHVKSELGKELDSLADVVSFGVAPTVLAHLLMLKSLPGGSIEYFSTWGIMERIVFFLPLLMPAFSAYRLAKFNLDTRQTTSFIGLPTPANALFWVSLVWGTTCLPEWYDVLFNHIYVLGICVLLLSVLLICELPMFSLKISNFAWQANKDRYLYFILLGSLALFLGEAIVLLMIPLYIVVALIQMLIKFISQNQ